MGSGPRGTAQDYITNQQTQATADRGAQSDYLKGKVEGSQGQFNDAFGTALQGYKDFNPNYSVTPDQIDQLWNSGGGATAGGGVGGNVIKSAFGPTSTNTFSNFANNGGLSSGFTNDFNGLSDTFNQQGNAINQAEGDFQSIFDTPVDAESANYMLANGTFQNFIDTGGFSDGDIQNLRARSISPLLSTFSNANDEINRTRSLQGGYSPNTTAALAKTARDLGYSSADASTNVEAGLADMIRQGKEWGAQGMSAAGTNLADLRQRGKLSASSGLANTALSAQQNAVSEQQAKLAVQQLDDQMRYAGAAGLSDQEKATLQAEIANAQIGAGGSSVNAQINAAKAMAIFNAETNLPVVSGTQNLEKLQGLTGLSGLAGGNLNNALSLFANNFNQGQGINSGLTNQFLQSFGLPTGYQSTISNIGQTIGLVGDVTGAMLGGFGGQGSGVPQNSGPGPFSGGYVFPTNAQGSESVWG